MWLYLLMKRLILDSNRIAIKEVIDFMSMNNFLLISTEQLPIVEYFNEKKLVQLNGIFAQRKLITTS